MVAISSAASITSITKAITGGLTKKKIMQGAGNALKDTAKGAVKKRLGRGKKGGGPGAPGGTGGGDIVQSPGGAIVPSSPLVGDIVIPYPEEPAKNKPKPVGVVDYESISLQLQSIVALTAAIEKITGKSIKSKKKIKDTNRKNREKAKKRQKEDRLSGVGGALGFLGGQLGKVAEASGIGKFLSNILTGFVVLKLLPLLPGILSSIKFIAYNLHYFFLGFKGLGLGMKLGVKNFKKNFPQLINKLKNIGKPIKDVFAKTGDRIKNVFKGLSRVIPNYIKAGFDAVKAAGQGVVQGVKNVGKFVTAPFRALARGSRSSLLGASAKGLEKLTGSAGKGVQQASSMAFKMRRLHGDEAARMYKGLVDNGMSNAKASKYVMKQIKAKNIVSAPLKGSLAGGIKGSSVFRGGPIKVGKRAIIKYLGKGPIVKKALRNVPVIGPLIVGVTSLLSGEPAAQALFKMGGTLVGGILGAFIPIPILGPIVGEIIGEYVGDLMYTLLMGGGPAAVMDKMKKDITSAMSAGSAAMDWAGRGFKRFMKGIPKLEMPGIVSWMFPKNMRSIPNPIWLMNPFNILDKMGLFWKSFFTDDPMTMGKEEKKENKSNGGGGDENPVSANPDAPPGPTSTGNNESPPTVLGERPGSDTSGLKSVPASSSQSKTPYNATGGNKNRKIFLHWTAGTYTMPFSYYHTVFLGDGKAVRYTPYGQDKYSHTQGANKGSIGLSVAAMDGPDGQDRMSSWPTPPTAAQMDAMITEAAQIANDWGWDSATVDSNVRTHGEWERYATKNGILPGGPQRWDLDKLKPSDPNIDTSKVLSHGGNTLRARIKAKMQALKAGANNNEEIQQPQSNPDAPPSPTNARLQTQNGRDRLALLAYGTNEWGMSRSYIKSKTKDLIQKLMDKGYKVVVIPPSPGLVVYKNPKGHVAIQDPHFGVIEAANDTGAKVEIGQYKKNDDLGLYVHLHPRYAREVKAKYKPDIVVGDSNAALINGGQSPTTKWGADYKVVSGMIEGMKQIQPTNTPQPPKPQPQPQEELIPQSQKPSSQKVKPTTSKAGDVKPKQEPLDLSSKTDEELKSMLDPTMMGAKNPAIFAAAKKARTDGEIAGLTGDEIERQVLEATVRATHGNQADGVTPQTDEKEPEITATSQPVSTSQSVERQASYDQPGGGQVSPVILPPKQNDVVSSDGGGSQIIPVGSKDVLNSYYQAQLMGFLYKQG